MNIQIVKQPQPPYSFPKPHYDVLQGSDTLGQFWFANGTIYALAANDESHMGTDIGLMETADAGNWVCDRYFELKKVSK